MRDELAKHLGVDVCCERFGACAYSWTILSDEDSMRTKAAEWIVKNRPQSEVHYIKGAKVHYNYCCGLKMRKHETDKRAEMHIKFVCRKCGKTRRSIVPKVAPGKALSRCYTGPRPGKQQVADKVADVIGAQDTKSDHEQPTIEVDALRIGQKWRDPENTETKEVVRGAVTGYPVVFTFGDHVYDTTELRAKGWRCIFDPQENVNGR